MKILVVISWQYLSGKGKQVANDADKIVRKEMIYMKKCH